MLVLVGPLVESEHDCLRSARASETVEDVFLRVLRQIKVRCGIAYAVRMATDRVAAALYVVFLCAAPSVTAPGQQNRSATHAVHHTARAKLASCDTERTTSHLRPTQLQHHATPMRCNAASAAQQRSPSAGCMA